MPASVRDILLSTIFWFQESNPVEKKLLIFALNLLCLDLLLSLHGFMAFSDWPVNVVAGEIFEMINLLIFL